MFACFCSFTPHLPAQTKNACLLPCDLCLLALCHMLHLNGSCAAALLVCSHMVLHLWPLSKSPPTNHHTTTTTIILVLIVILTLIVIVIVIALIIVIIVVIIIIIISLPFGAHRLCFPFLALRVPYRALSVPFSARSVPCRNRTVSFHFNNSFWYNFLLSRTHGGPKKKSRDLTLRQRRFH